MSDDSDDRTASLMTPAKLAQLNVRPKPAASPAAWLDQLAADAGSAHVRRLLDLRQQLAAQASESEWGGVAAAAKALAGALQQLDFSQLQARGWLARATGKGKGEAAAFVAQYERIVGAGEDLAGQARELQKQLAQAAAADRRLLEMEVEVRAIEKIMDQGARWLQDMRNQLKTRQAQGGDAAAQKQIADDTARCELLVVRLKQLRAASSAAQPVVERCRSVAAQRATVVQALQRLLETEWKAWQKKLAPVAEQAVASGSAEAGLDGVRKAREDLQAALKQLARDGGDLQTQEQALADELAGLQAQLQAVA